MPTNLQLPMSLSSLNSKLNKRRGWEGGTGTVQQWKCVQDILGNVKPVECFLWLNFRVYVHGSEVLARQRNVYHLHSTASTFWGGEEDEGLIPVSEEADDMDAPVCDTSLSFFFNRFLLLSMVATSDFKDM